MEVGVDYYRIYECFPHTSHRSNIIWIIVDQLTKSAYFMSIYTSFNTKRFAHIYIWKIVRLHGDPMSIILDKGSVLLLDFVELLGGVRYSGLSHPLFYTLRPTGSCSKLFKF